MFNKKMLLATTAIIFTFSGCATVMDGETQTITINSNPSGLRATLDGKVIHTPAIIKIKREEYDRVIRVDDDKLRCHKIITLNKQVNPTFFANLLSGGSFGSTTDYASGSMWKYDDNVNIDCK